MFYGLVYGLVLRAGLRTPLIASWRVWGAVGRAGRVTGAAVVLRCGDGFARPGMVVAVVAAVQGVVVQRTVEPIVDELCGSDVKGHHVPGWGGREKVEVGTTKMQLFAAPTRLRMT